MKNVIKETKQINEFCVNPADGHNNSSSLFNIYIIHYSPTLILKSVVQAPS